MIKERNLTCIVCPRGCALTVKFDEEGKVASVSGNACKRGVTYAENECTHPVRTVTTTVRCENGEVIPVKTTCPIPKEMMMDIMKILSFSNYKNQEWIFFTYDRKLVEDTDNKVFRLSMREEKENE